MCCYLHIWITEISMIPRRSSRYESGTSVCWILLPATLAYEEGIIPLRSMISNDAISEVFMVVSSAFAYIEKINHTEIITMWAKHLNTLHANIIDTNILESHYATEIDDPERCDLRSIYANTISFSIPKSRTATGMFRIGSKVFPYYRCLCQLSRCPRKALCHWDRCFNIIQSPEYLCWCHQHRHT